MTQTTQSVSPLRQRMIDDMMMRKLSPKTQSQYIRAVKNLARYLGHSPHTATAEELRQYQLSLVNDGISRIMLNANLTALKFFFITTLDRADALTKISTVRLPLCCRFECALFCAHREKQNRCPLYAKDPAMNIDISMMIYFAGLYRKVTTQIPIARLPSMTARLRPAVSSLEACQTPAR